MRSVLVALAITACGNPPADDSGVLVTEEGGSSIVRLPVLSTLQLPEWRLERAYGTSDGSEAVPLFRVVDALFLPDSSLIVVNGGASELLLFDPEGRLARRIGQEGEGPGDFRQIDRLFPVRDGGFSVFDARLSRLTRYDALAEIVDVSSLAQGNRFVSLIPVSLWDDGMVLLIPAEQRYFGADYRRDTVPLTALQVGSEKPDTIATWLGFERSFAARGSGRATIPLGFARTVYVGSNGGVLAIGSSDSVDVTVYRGSVEPVLRIVAPPDPQAPTEEQKEAWLAAFLETIPEDSPTRSLYEQSPVRDTFPGFDGIEVDGRGRIWLAEYPKPGIGMRRWVILGPDGRPLGQVHLPVRRQGWQPGPTEILAVGGDLIALLVVDDLDVETVEVWWVSPPPAG